MDQIDKYQSFSDNNQIDWRRERFAFNLDESTIDISKTNTIEDDVKSYGSKFIADWVIRFTQGKLKVTLKKIYPVLIHGIRFEGQLYTASQHIIQSLIDELEQVKNNTKIKSNAQLMKSLSKACVNLYTRDCFLFRQLNKTLRDDDRSKLNTFGPYAYLIYNYIGLQFIHYFSLTYRFRQHLSRKQTQAILVYRGDFITNDKLDKYKQAIGQTHKYFKWLSFVSTSRDQAVAQSFTTNVLYKIHLKESLLNDQFVDLFDDTHMPQEKEVLLRAGVRFTILNLDFDSDNKWNIVHIKIIPSYISNLR